MRRIPLLISLLFVCFACSDDDELRHNPYLPNLKVVLQLDLDLPQYNQLNFPGNSYETYNYGINGIAVYNLNNDQYMAFELTDPNHVIRDCSVLTVHGTEAICDCNDGKRYTIITGQQTAGEGQYPLKPYRVVRIGNILEISN